jgi:hypothetical protein
MKKMKPEDIVDASDLRPIPDDGINMNPWGDEPDDSPYFVVNDKYGNKLSFREVEEEICITIQNQNTNPISLSFDKEQIPDLIVFLNEKYTSYNISSGELLFNEIVKTVEEGGYVSFNGYRVDIGKDVWKNDPENEVLYFLWEQEDEEYNEKLTEEDLCNAQIVDGNIIIPYNPFEFEGICSDADDVIILYRKYPV